MRLSTRMKLISTSGLLLAIIADLTLFGATRGTGHASGTLPQSSTPAGCGSWHVVHVGYPPAGSGNFGLGGVVALSPNNVWAVGDYIEHWDGTKWNVDPWWNGVNWYGGLNGVAALSANDMWAVGGTTGSSVDADDHLGGTAVIVHWNGTKWSLVPGANLDTSSSYLNA